MSTLIFSLTKDDVRLYYTNEGTFIVKLAEFKSSYTPAFEDARQRIVKRIRRERAFDLAASEAARLAQVLKDDPFDGRKLDVGLAKPLLIRTHEKLRAGGLFGPVYAEAALDAVEGSVIDVPDEDAGRAWIVRVVSHDTPQPDKFARQRASLRQGFVRQQRAAMNKWVGSTILEIAGWKSYLDREAAGPAAPGEGPAEGDAPSLESSEDASEE